MNLYCDNRHRNNSFTILDWNLWSSKTPVHGCLINCIDLGREAYESMRCARPVIASQNVLTGSRRFLKLCFLKFHFLAWITLFCLKCSSVNRQIQLIECYCTGLEAGASFYRILVSIKLLSPVRRFHIWQAKMDEISPNFANFLRLVESRSITEKKAGDTKKCNFLTDRS